MNQSTQSFNNHIKTTIFAKQILVQFLKVFIFLSSWSGIASISIITTLYLSLFSFLCNSATLGVTIGYYFCSRFSPEYWKFLFLIICCVLWYRSLNMMTIPFGPSKLVPPEGRDGEGKCVEDEVWVPLPLVRFKVVKSSIIFSIRVSEQYHQRNLNIICTLWYY